MFYDSIATEKAIAKFGANSYTMVLWWKSFRRIVVCEGKIYDNIAIEETVVDLVVATEL